MLHRISGDMLRVELERAYGRDSEHRVIATEDNGKIYVLCTNPTGEIIPCRLSVDGLEAVRYSVTQYLCDDKLNNCVTGKGNGKLESTKSEMIESTDGKLTIDFILERDNFILFEIEKSDQA